MKQLKKNSILLAIQKKVNNQIKFTKNKKLLSQYRRKLCKINQNKENRSLKRCINRKKIIFLERNMKNKVHTPHD